MDPSLATSLSFDVLLAGTLPFAEVWLAAAIVGVTASAFASGIPGTLLPISFSSGALLGGWLAILVVALGATVGSLVLYLLFERGSQAALLERYADRLARAEQFTSKAGILLANAGHTSSSKSFHAGSKSFASNIEIGDPAKYSFPSGLQ